MYIYIYTENNYYIEAKASAEKITMEVINAGQKLPNITPKYIEILISTVL